MAVSKRGSDSSSITVDQGRPNTSVKGSLMLLFIYPVAPTALGTFTPCQQRAAPPCGVEGKEEACQRLPPGSHCPVLLGTNDTASAGALSAASTPWKDSLGQGGLKTLLPLSEPVALA